MKALIVSTAHWSGDPRLNRHVEYLEAAGIGTQLVTLHSDSKFGRLFSVLRAISAMRRVRPGVVILPDPELFIAGSAAARILGIRPLVDIHEDYARASASREWIPRPFRSLVGGLAILNDRLARGIASVVVVAAPELSSPDSTLVSNVPDPSRFLPTEANLRDPTAIYIGDVTVARGALEIAELANLLPNVRFQVVGPVNDDLRARITSVAGPHARLVMTGRLPHDEAWSLARGAVAGLSLLRPLPAYRSAIATKLWEYGASGIPPVVTDLPGQRAFVNTIDPSLVQSGLGKIAGVINRLATERDWQSEMASRARQAAQRGWDRDRPDIAIVKAVQP